jgi:hypothetical protein
MAVGLWLFVDLPAFDFRVLLVGSGSALLWTQVQPSDEEVR